MKTNEYLIYHIGDIRTVAEIEFDNNNKKLIHFSQAYKINDEIDFRISPNDFKVLKIHKLPRSKIVTISDITNENKQYLIVRSTTSHKLYYLLDKFTFGIYENGREEKYKNIYLIYEALENNKQKEYIAVRHAISHPTLNDVKVINTIRNIYGDNYIDLKKKKHRTLFRKLYLNLYQRTKTLLLKEILKSIRGSKLIIASDKEQCYWII